MDIIELQYENANINLELKEKKIEYWDYLLTIKDAHIETRYSLTTNEIKNLIKGTERFLNQLKEKFHD